MAKLSELKGTVDELKAQALKAFGEIRSKLDEQKAKIDELLAQLGDVEIPADAQASIDELKALTQQLDDVVPDAPPA